MNISFRKNLFIILVILICANVSFTQTGTSLVDTSKYYWLNPSINAIQFYDVKAIANLYKTWQNVDEEKLVFLHLGDSHLQPDVLPSRVRNHLHKDLGDGGRGFIFPYSTVKTYSPKEYDASHTGIWEGSRSLTLVHRVPLGARGMSCRTKQANSSFSFKFKVPVPAAHDVLKIFCKKTAKSYDLIVEAGGQRIPVNIDETNAQIPYVSVKIPKITDKLTVRTVQKNPQETEFECYGLSLESSQNKGAIWHNAGVGGARYMSILYQKLFKAQAPFLEADVVILDFGTNDYLYYDKITPELEGEIKRVIQTVREIAPEASIILTTAQDLYYKGRNVTSGGQFAELIHKIAKETQCCVYDWYWIAGGQKIMKVWKQKKLSYDSIHLTWAGAFIKGDMFYEALKNTLAWLKQNPTHNSLVLPTTELKKKNPYIIRPVAPPKKQTPSPSNSIIKPNPKGGITVDKTEKIHTVKKGETLSAIARKYLASVAEIKTWNNLTSNTIYSDQKLVIYPKSGNYHTPQPVVPIQKSLKTSSTNSANLHTVQDNETIYSISRKYNMTTTELKTLNNLKDNSIKAGQKLKIKNNTKQITHNPVQSTQNRFHIVKEEETLYSISRDYKVKVADLKKWNNLPNNDIKAGQKLIVGTN